MIQLPAQRPLIAPSLLSCDFSRIGEEIRAVELAGADLLHVDVMDGHFVPNITIGPPVVAAMKRASSVPLDVHLMITEPDRYLESFATAGAAILTVHSEACVHLHRTIQTIKRLGCLAGVSLNPATPVEVLTDILSELDLVLIMSVNPGFGGQSFIPSSLEKIRRLKTMALRAGLDRLLIEVDGGVTRDNTKALRDAGTDILVAGNAVFSSGDYASYIASMRNAALV
jgi:ribulose-phosphate 3-epimerase